MRQAGKGRKHRRVTDALRVLACWWLHREHPGGIFLHVHRTSETCLCYASSLVTRESSETPARVGLWEARPLLAGSSLRHPLGYGVPSNRSWEGPEHQRVNGGLRLELRPPPSSPHGATLHDAIPCPISEPFDTTWSPPPNGMLCCNRRGRSKTAKWLFPCSPCPRARPCSWTTFLCSPCPRAWPCYLTAALSDRWALSPPFRAGWPCDLL